MRFHLTDSNGSAIEATSPQNMYMAPYSTNCRERGYLARGVYPTEGTSRMRTARVKSSKKSGKLDHGHEEETSQTRPN